MNCVAGARDLYTRREGRAREHRKRLLDAGERGSARSGRSRGGGRDESLDDLGLLRVLAHVVVDLVDVLDGDTARGKRSGSGEAEEGRERGAPVRNEELARLDLSGGDVVVHDTVHVLVRRGLTVADEAAGGKKSVQVHCSPFPLVFDDGDVPSRSGQLVRTESHAASSYRR